MPIKLNGATNGSIELDVPAAVGSDLQLTLPATAGEVVVKDSSGNITTTGDATFGGEVEADDGFITNGTSFSSPVVIGKQNGTTTSTLRANGDLLIAGDVGANPNILLSNTGNAVFAGSVLSGSSPYSGANVGSIVDVGGIACTKASGASTIWNGFTQGNSTATSSIKADGSASFVKVDAVFNSSVDVGLNLRNSSTGTSARFYSGSSIVGSITVTGSATAFNTSSDYRLKENVVDIADGITRVKQLQPKRFNFIADDTTTVDGFIAHEAQTVVPEAVTGQKDATREEEYVVTPAIKEVVDEDGNVTTAAADAVMGTRTVPDHQGIDQSKLVPLLTAALQEVIAKIETLETQNASLEARLTALEGGS